MQKGVGQMSELDKYFPRTHNQPPPQTFIPSRSQPGCTNWPNVQEMYRETLDEWTDCQGFLPEDKHTRRQWEAGARDFVEAHGEKPRLLRKAWEFYLDIDFERRQSIVVSTPRSLIGFARKVLETEEEKRKRDPDSKEVRYQKAMSWIDEEAKEAWWHD